MILLPEWLESAAPHARGPRRRPRPPFTLALDDTSVDTPFGELLPNEQLAVRDLLHAGETVRGVVRGADADEVYVWLVTPRRVLQLLHGRCQVALYRVLAITDVRAAHVRTDGTWAQLELTTRRRAYALHHVPLPAALAFVQQLGLEAVLTMQGAASHPAES
ncbi:MAG: hypothetical protein K2R93_16315 [Gemmatimonadaceae bacterium]|nr:hypothetical protein [Gemmatimonadaceae bacterium]